MIQLIVNADDFGLSEGTNYGIIHGHINGIVNSTTMMMNMPAVEHAVRLANEYPSLGSRGTSRFNCWKAAPYERSIPRR
ncbi:Protein of unknown function [Bacillus cytotoxicus]|nr:Protein of unknown function [Bacillus cytotoxicus]